MRNNGRFTAAEELKLMGAGEADHHYRYGSAPYGP